MTMDVTRLTVVRVTCDRCGAISEVSLPGVQGAEQGSSLEHRKLSLLRSNFPGWQSRNDGAEHLCPDCAASYQQWFEAGKNIAVTQVADASGAA